MNLSLLSLVLSFFSLFAQEARHRHSTTPASNTVGQKIPVYGNESSKKNGGLERKNTGDSENPGHRQVLEIEKGIVSR